MAASFRAVSSRSPDENTKPTLIREKETPKGLLQNELPD